MRARAARTLRRSAAALLCLASHLGTVRAEPAAPPPLTLELLMQRFASTRGVRAEFQEQKQIALLDVPLASSGVLYFVPPRRFARFVTQPAASCFVIDGDRLEFHDETGAESVDLSGNRVARAIVDHMIGLWSGDLPALREHYAVGFRAEGARWTIELRPLRAPIDQVIERIELEGDGPRLLQMQLVERGGDRTQTTFSKTEVDRELSTAELERIFPPAGATPRP